MRRRWKKQEIEKLGELWMSGAPTADVTRRLRCSAREARNKACEHGYRRPKWYIARINRHRQPRQHNGRFK